jgi:hypothetical protein
MSTTTTITTTGGGGGSSTTYGAIPPIGIISGTSSTITTTITPPYPYPTGAVGSASNSGLMWTGSGTSGTTWGNSSPNTIITITGDDPTLSTNKHKINLNELAEMMTIMRERFLIIVPDFEKHEKYTALKKAYDHYKLLESMISGEKK